MNAETQVLRAYVTGMMAFLGRALAAASRVDEVVRDEVSGYPVGFTFEMGVLPSGPATRVRKRADGTLERVESTAERPHLAIRFKHLRHAFVSLTFQEGTARSLADDRFLVDGDPAWAMRMQRILDRILVLTLPRPVASRALKRYPALSTRARAAATSRLFAGLARDLVGGAP